MANSAKSARSELVLALALSIVCALGVCVFGVCASGAGAQSFSDQHAKIALLAEDGALKPGQTAWIGLFFDLEQGLAHLLGESRRFRRGATDPVGASQRLSSGRYSLAGPDSFGYRQRH